MGDDWNTDMNAAPEDKPILAWCIHDADYYQCEETGKLSPYAAHVEGIGNRLQDGPHVIEWGGEYFEDDYEAGLHTHIPNWWFQYGSGFEMPASPVAWRPIETPSFVGVDDGVAWPVDNMQSIATENE